MRRTRLRLILTILLLALAAVMCWLAQPALAPSDTDSAGQPPTPTPSSDGAQLAPSSPIAASFSGSTPRAKMETRRNDPNHQPRKLDFDAVAA